MKQDLTRGDTNGTTAKSDTEESLSDRDSPLGRYYRWLLDDPISQDYWKTRRADKEPTGRPRDQEES